MLVRMQILFTQDLLNLTNLSLNVAAQFFHASRSMQFV